MSDIIKHIDKLTFSLSDIPNMPQPCNVLMVEPTYFDVEYVINPHMENHVGAVDKMQALNEWKHIADFYKQLGLKLKKLEGRENMPDMVFCANQCLPFLDKNGHKKAIMGRMLAEQRKPEVEHIEKFMAREGYETIHLDSQISDFEGMGDALWHFKKRLLWGGYGYRTSPDAYREISEITQTPVIALELVDEYFYHLDTCLCILNESSAVIYPDAFTKAGLELIHALFETVIESTSYEAKKLFAVNAVCPDGRNVLIQQGCTDLNKKLRDAGFSVHEFSTFEFIKSGGSVFCMKLIYW